MTARWPNAFLLSTTLHAAGVTLLLLAGYMMVVPERPRQIMELVAASVPAAATERTGDASREAVTTPAVRFTAPQVSRPASQPVAADEAEPPVPAPRAAAAPRVATSPARSVANAESPAGRVNAKKLSEADFRRQHGKAAPAQAAAPAVRHIDAGNAGTELRRAGTAAVEAAGTRPARSEAEAYRASLEQALREALERVPGLDDSLAAEAEFRVLPDGRIVQPRIVVSSGDSRFDGAIVQALQSLRLGTRPAGFDEVQRVPFNTVLRR